MNDTTAKLTTWDYMYKPLRELILHPDFDHYRFLKVCAAVKEANRLIQEAINEGKL